MLDIDKIALVAAAKTVAEKIIFKIGKLAAHLYFTVIGKREDNLAQVTLKTLNIGN